MDSLLQSDVLTLLASPTSPEGIVLAIGSRVARAGLSITAAPDVYGTAGIRVDGTDYPALNVALTPTEEDAYQVEFSGVGGWAVPGTSAIRVVVTLVDRDVIYNDPIGTVTLTEEHFRQAWNEDPDSEHWIQVNDQMTAILFLRVLVRNHP